MSALWTSAGVSVGWASSISAAIPATTGAANDVPDPLVPNNPLVEYQSDSPGAARVERLPLLVHQGLAPPALVAVTAITFGKAAGYATLSIVGSHPALTVTLQLEFPAAAITTTPWATAQSIV